MMAVRTSTAMSERVHTSAVPPASMASACIPLAGLNASSGSGTYLERLVILRSARE
jgi:hypothetical protein